ncbi:MAG: ATP-binding protein [Chloroflexi bacterium]|nr:ATP-binding protein [Chloroflexota bacterium]
MLTGTAVILLSGVPGAGKTTVARRLLELLPVAAHIESDAIRRSLSPSPDYTRRESSRVFAVAGKMTRTALARGQAAIIDATNLAAGDRARFIRAAYSAGVPLVAVRVLAPDGVVRARLRAPRDGYSQAGPAVFEEMRGRARPFTVPVVAIDTRFPLEPSLALIVELSRAPAGGTDAR